MESPQQCKNRIICKLRGSFPGHGPFSSYDLCKKQTWIPHLPEDWFLSATLGKKVNVLVDMDKIERDGKDSRVEPQDKNDGDDDGITLEGLPKTIVRLILGLVLGGDDAICR